MKIKDITHIAKLIGSYLNKTLSSQERQELEIWMRKSPRHLMLFKKFIHHNGHVTIFNYQIREDTNWQADLVLVTDPVTGLSKYRLVNLHILKRG